MSKKIHKSGFVSIIGRPNVGKSTLINALMEDKLSIITSKAQTTRHSWYIGSKLSTARSYDEVYK